VLHLLYAGIDPAIIAELAVSWNATHCDPPLPANRVRILVWRYAKPMTQSEALDFLLSEAVRYRNGDEAGHD